MEEITKIRENIKKEKLVQMKR